MFFLIFMKKIVISFCKTKKIHENSLHYVMGKTCKLCTDSSLNDTCYGFTLVIIHACQSMIKKMLEK